MERAKLPDNFADRPDDYLGESVSSYLQSPRRTKLKTSWLDKGDGESEQLDGPVGDDKPQRRNSGSMISQKLSELKEKNETCQAKNDALQVRNRRHSHHPAASKRAAKKSDDSVFSDKTASTESTWSNEPNAATKNQHEVALTRQDVQFLAERPGDWLGGEGEEAEVAEGYLKKPKTKLRTTWLENSKEDSQSLRDLTSGTTDNSKQPLNNLHASESQLRVGPAQRRKTSPLVMQQLSALKQKNDENHQKNEDLAIPKDSSSKTFRSQTTTAATTSKLGVVEGSVTQSSQSNNKIRVQRELKDEELHLLDRPDTWMGGEGEAAQPYSYLQKPHKTKLKTSWLNDGGGADMSQSMRDVTSSVPKKDEDHDDLHASESDLFSARRRKTSPLIMGKLGDFQKHNEDNHKRNEELPPPVVATLDKSSTKTKKELSKPTENVVVQVEQPKAKVPTVKVKIQRELKDEELHLLDRPDSWMGGEGEEAKPYSYLQKPHKTKLKTSWLNDGGGSDMSQSMRDVTSGPKDDAHDDLNASDSFFSARRRKTSPLVMGKLGGFQKQNEENHKKNEELAPVVSAATTSSTTTKTKKAPSKPTENVVVKADQPKAKAPATKVRIQRELKDEELHLLERPDTWMGGEGEAAQPYSYLQKPHKTKLKTSWLNDGGGSDMSQSMRDVTSGPKDDAHDDLNASDSFFSARRRKTSPLVMGKLVGFQKQNEENQKMNDELAPVVSIPAKSSATIKPGKGPSKPSVKSGSGEEQPKAKAPTQKVKIQRELKDEELHLLDRPDTWMGGEGEEAQPYSYLQKPHKTKLKTSWVNDGGSDMSQSMRDVTAGPKKDDDHDDLHASESDLFSARRRKTSPLIMGKLVDFQKQNEDNNKRNEELTPVVSAATTSSTSIKPGKKSSKAAENVVFKAEQPKAKAPTQKVKTQSELKDEELHLLDRPDTWMGGEGEAAQPYSYLQKPPKTKLKTSWLHDGGGTDMSQSMRDVTAVPKDDDHDDLHASESDLFSARRRKTSPSVIGKLVDFQKQNEENQKRNEELTAIEKG